MAWAMHRKHKILALLLVLIVVDYFIPYSALSGVRKFHGAFLFWIVLSFFVMALVIAFSAKWRE